MGKKCNIHFYVVSLNIHFKIMRGGEWVSPSAGMWGYVLTRKTAAALDHFYFQGYFGLCLKVSKGDIRDTTPHLCFWSVRTSDFQLRIRRCIRQRNTEGNGLSLLLRKMDLSLKTLVSIIKLPPHCPPRLFLFPLTKVKLPAFEA